MKTLTLILTLLTGLQSLNLSACGTPLNQTNGPSSTLNVGAWLDCSGKGLQMSLPDQAVIANPAIAEFAINALRSQGPIGLDQLWDAHAQSIRQHASGPVLANEDPSAWYRLRTALDKVSGQHDAYMSHLFWYTNLSEAEAAAKAANRPILSLRLLGRLDQEYSCANSRFFRTTLYANAEIAAYLRQHFILHWQSVRPVPRITIDFGDGRKLEQTITGNSIHYILAPDGRVIDALPGLYGPKTFLNGLTAAEQETLAYISLDSSQQDTSLKQYHDESRKSLLAHWNEDLSKLALGNRSPQNVPADDDLWTQVASLHTEDAQLDSSAQLLIQRKTPNAFAAGRIAESKSKVETPMLRQIRKFRNSTAIDTIRNEYQLHATIHEWLAAGPPSGGLDGFNRKVYAELFLMPESDPWLGLAPTDTFTGLDHAGLTQNH